MMTPRWLPQIVAAFLPRVRSNLHVDAGDLLRDRREWSDAADCYRRALQICADRRPIWLQLGHMLRENGDAKGALCAYRRACALPGESDDAAWHLGRVAKQLGLLVEAKAALREARRIAPENTSICREFMELLHDPDAVDDPARQAAEALNAAEMARLELSASRDQMQVVFDASDLIRHFRHSRLPTGIQRVQIEVISAAFDLHPQFQIGCFSDRVGNWLRIPFDHFQTLCALSMSSGDRTEAAWIDALDTLTATLAAQATVTFVPGAFLVNLGSSWAIPNYFLHVRRVRNCFGIHYVPFVHDLIPLVAPEHFTDDVVQDFVGWTMQIFRDADGFFVNSRATRDDLERAAIMLGHCPPPANIAVVPLNADFRRAGLADAPLSALAQWQLQEGRFVLLVSTVEARKDHAIALRAWRDLIDRHGADKVPDLVCVGHRGWLSDHVYAALDDDPILSAKVRMLSHVSDAQLSLLYRQCLFTLYPSKYEGWGLPITESLCFNKVPVLCRQSSMPEAGGRFACYFEPGDIAGLVAEAEKLIFDTGARATLEQRICDGLVVRTWAEIAHQIIADLDRFGKTRNGGPSRSDNPIMIPHRLYRLTRNQRRQLSRDIDEGEQFRAGSGWWQPEDWGCWTRAEGGEIAFALGDDVSRVRVWLRLNIPPASQSDVTIHCQGRELRFDWPAGPACWVSFVADVCDRNISFVIRGRDSIDLAPVTDWRDRRTIGIGISGLLVMTSEIGRDVLAVTRALAESPQNAVRFVCDALLLLRNRVADTHDLQDFFPHLESGYTSRLAMIESIGGNGESVQTLDHTVVFD